MSRLGTSTQLPNVDVQNKAFNSSYRFGVLKNYVFLVVVL